MIFLNCLIALDNKKIRKMDIYNYFRRVIIKNREIINAGIGDPVTIDF